MVGSSSSPSHSHTNNLTAPNSTHEPQRHHTISGSTSGRSNGSISNLSTQSSSSQQMKSLSANSSPRLSRRNQSTSSGSNTTSPRPRRHAPPPPTGVAPAGNGASLSRKNKAKLLKDNRYSLQIEPSDLYEHQGQPTFGSLPRRSAGPAPPTRRESIPEGSSSSSKPPLHPSVSIGSTSSLQDAKLGGYSSFVSPHQTSSSTLQPISVPARRYSSDAAVSGAIAALSTPPEVRRSSTNTSPQKQQLQSSQPQTTTTQYQYNHSTSSTGSHGSEKAAVTNSPRSGSNRSSSSPGSPRKNRSRSTSKERELAQQSGAAVVPVVKIELPTNFSNSDGMELVEAVRKRTGVSHRKSLVAINEVLEFLKGRVPLCGEMVDALLSAVQQTQQV